MDINEAIKNIREILTKVEFDKEYFSLVTQTFNSILDKTVEIEDLISGENEEIECLFNSVLNSFTFRGRFREREKHVLISSKNPTKIQFSYGCYSPNVYFDRTDEEISLCAKGVVAEIAGYPENFEELVEKVKNTLFILDGRLF